ncbi:poly-gamma-glutamate system protein [bacterium]|nr:poly-gamma-glutamate system protein [bacterium]
MAFRPSLRSIWTLVAMSVVCYGLYLWAEYSRIEVKRANHELKLVAANRMSNALRELASRQFSGSESLESYGDPRVDALIGQQFSTITSDIGSFEEKLYGANPNLAAAVIELLLDAGLKSGDKVAIALSGSTPGANISVLCACNALGVDAYTLSSLSSTWWGATDPRNTWADMQSFLIDKGIVNCTVVGYSLGGIDDNALGMSSLGRTELIEAVGRNKARLIEATSLSESSREWWKAFRASLNGQVPSAYINVGDGLASLGHKENGQLLGNGVHRRLPARNWPGNGVVHIAAKENVPIINFYSSTELSKEYGLGSPRLPLTEPGIGDVFVTIKYDLRVAIAALVITLAALFTLVWFDSKYFRLADAGVDPETLL